MLRLLYYLIHGEWPCEHELKFTTVRVDRGTCWERDVIFYVCEKCEYVKRLGDRNGH